jgi:hypothetical protein
MRSFCIGADPTQDNVVPGCLSYYTVKSGDSCVAIESACYITFPQFLQWNPDRRSFSSPLELDYYLLMWFTQLEVIVSVCGWGMLCVCKGLTLHPRDQRKQVSRRIVTVTIQWLAETRARVSRGYLIYPFPQFLAWNPAIGFNCESLLVDYSVCISVSS